MPPVLPLRRPSVELPEHVPARMLNEFVYCPRLFFYEWVDGVFSHNSDTIEGSPKHEKGDKKEGELPEADALEGERVRARGVMLASDELGLVAKMDLIEADAGAVTPVDYKRGRPRDGIAGPEAWPADEIQIAAQAMVLRHNGYTCHEGVLFYYQTRQRVRIAITDALADAVTQRVTEAREVARSGAIPPPLVDSPKCPRCSLVSICLPDETIASAGLSPWDDEPNQVALFGDVEEARRLPSLDPEEVRRLVPARDDRRPLYVTGYQLSVGKSGERLQVRDKGQVVQEARLNDLSQVNLFGPVSISGAAVQATCANEIPIAHFSMGGWFYGLTQGLGLKNVFLRQAQFLKAQDERFCLDAARDLVTTKIRNQRTLLQRNHVEPRAITLDSLKRLADRAQRSGSIESLLGVEGTAAAAYFGDFAGMIKVEPEEGDLATFDFEVRNRRPPRDPVNALLSFAYSLLTRDLTITCHAVGFDPFLGFYHQPRFGRPALALDLMEGFRPLVADSVVLSVINTRMVTADDFLRTGNAVGLTRKGRSALIRAYEQRMDQLVTHPVFGYRISYRRVLEVQVRLLARYVTGEIGRYPGFETR